MEKKTKLSLLYIAFGVILFVALMNLSSVWRAANTLIGLILPIIVGLIVAFVLSVPMTGFEKLFAQIFKNFSRRPGDKIISIVSLLLTFACLGLIITIVVTLAVPALVSSVTGLVEMIKEKWPEWMALLGEYDIDTDRISQFISRIDIKQLFQNLSGSATALLDSVVNVSTSIVSAVITAVFGFVISVYVLLSKKDLARHCKKIAYAYMKKTAADRLCYICSLIHNTYSKFLSGQCLEAVILGVLIFMAFSIFKLPYAGLVAMLTGVFAFVPYVGAFAACFIGALLTLITTPSQVLLSIIVYLVIQFVENQFIYPRVVGSSVGLSPLWTLIAALIGGELFGVLGMIFFIPMFAVICSLFRDATNRRLREKSPPQENLW